MKKIALIEFLSKMLCGNTLKIYEVTSLAFHHCPTELPEKMPMHTSL